MSDVDNLADEIIERLTPKKKRYSISVERTMTDFFDYEVDAVSEEDAIAYVKELATNESDFMSEIDITVDFVTCLDVEETDEDVVHPMQISFGALS